MKYVSTRRQYRMTEKGSNEEAPEFDEEYEGVEDEVPDFGDDEVRDFGDDEVPDFGDDEVPDFDDEVPDFGDEVPDFGDADIPGTQDDGPKDKGIVGGLFDKIFGSSWEMWIGSILLATLSICLFVIKSPWGSSGGLVNWGTISSESWGLPSGSPQRTTPITGMRCSPS